jgi:hypothetical protein
MHLENKAPPALSQKVSKALKHRGKLHKGTVVPPLPNHDEDIGLGPTYCIDSKTVHPVRVVLLQSLVARRECLGMLNGPALDLGKGRHGFEDLVRATCTGGR